MGSLSGSALNYRFSIFDLLILTFAITVALIWYQAKPLVEFPFDDLFLSHHAPKVPEKFNDFGRPNPSMSLSVDGKTRYQSGADLYLSYHYSDWHAVGVKFANHRLYWREQYDWQSTCSQLTNNRWTPAHVQIARYDGQLAAIQQLERLLAEYSEKDLRDRLLDVPWYRPVLEYIRPITMTIVLLVVVVIRSCRGNWKKPIGKI